MMSRIWKHEVFSKVKHELCRTYAHLLRTAFARTRSFFQKRRKQGELTKKHSTFPALFTEEEQCVLTQVKNAFVDMSFDETNLEYSCISSKESESILFKDLDIEMITEAFREELKSFITKCCERFPFPDFNEIANYVNQEISNGGNLLFLNCMQRGAVERIRNTFEKYAMNRVSKLNKKF